MLRIAGIIPVTIMRVYGGPDTKSDGTQKENNVTSVQYFFYNDITADPIYNSGRIANPTMSNLKYSVTLTAGVDGVPDLGTLFSNDNICTVFAVFNAAEITEAPLATVKQTAASDTFSYQADDGWTVIPEQDPAGHEKYFVMAGELGLKRSSDVSAAITGTSNCL